MARFKQSLLCRISSLVLIAVFLCAAAPRPAFAGRRSVRVPAGTPVPVRTVETLSSATLKTGDSVELAVVSDVVVDGVAVIRAGAAARGQVAGVKRSALLGSPGEFTIDARSAEAVDGSAVRLSGSKTVEGQSKLTTSVVVGLLCCILGFFMRGEHAVLSSGAEINAVTLGETGVSR